MSSTEIAKKYIALLQAGDMDSIVDLFSENGKVVSPLYGTLPAKEFYQKLNADTSGSKLKINGIFEEKSKNRIALYFEYIWSMKNNETVNFDVVDIIEFDKEGKIGLLIIIYDTVKTRISFDKMI